jgi:drug/metabolite transporter (DMT)-like permease
MTSQSNNFKGSMMVLVSAVLFGSYGVWSRLIGDSFGSFFQGYSRGVIICVVLFPVLYYKKQIVSIPKKDWKWMSVFLLFTSGTQAPLFYAFNHMDIGTATLLFYVSMLLTMYVVGFLFLGEKVTRIKAAAFVLALMGMMLTFSFSIKQFAILAAVAAAFNGVASGGEVAFSKKLTGIYSPLYVSALSWLIIIPTNGFISVLLGEQQALPSFNAAWGWQICYTVASLFAFWLIIKGLQFVEASVGGLIGILEIVFSIMFGIVIFGESIASRAIVGGLLIMFAASLPHVSTLVVSKGKK